MGRPRGSNEFPVQAHRLGTNTLRSTGAAQLIGRPIGTGTRPDMLERLREDPGARTLGRLLQGRQWALQEIERLTDEVLRLRSQPAAKASSREIVSETEAARRTQALRDPNRLIRMKELRQLLGLGPSTIYRMMGEGRFPRSVHLGERTTAWRLADIEAWQANLR